MANLDARTAFQSKGVVGPKNAFMGKKKWMSIEPVIRGVRRYEREVYTRFVAGAVVVQVCVCSRWTF